MSWLVLALAAAAFAGLVPIFGKVGLKAVDATVATTARCLIMTFMLVTVLLCQGKPDLVLKLTGKEWVPIILSGLCGAASWLCYFEALKLGNASQVASIDKLSLAVTVILAAVFLSEALTGKVALGAALICLGAFVVTQK
jgi:transporter family protein